MKQYANVSPITQNESYFGIAKVLDTESDNGRVKLLWEKEGQQQTIEALVATYRTKPLEMGDQVLVSGESIYQLFVVGIIGKPQADDQKSNEIVVANGASAKLVKSGERETLNVYSSQGKLLFCYDAENNTTRVNIPKGDLVLASEEGNVELFAEKEVKLNGQSVKLESKRLSIHAPYAQMIFGRLESVSDTIIEGAKNVFRDVKELTQIRTGRMRTFVDETYQFRSKKASIKADEDYKVDADKIHLG